MYPVLFHVGAVEIRSYTVCMLAAVLLGGWLTYREAARRNRLDDETLVAASFALLGGVLGAKLGMLLFLGPAEFWRLLPTLPAHGAAWAGAFGGGLLAGSLCERIYGMERCIGDLAAPFLPLGQAIGRLGNFLAGDAYGATTRLPWGVYQGGAWRHPAQLYELGLDLLLFALLLHQRTRTFRDGELFRLYAIGYALIRFPLEFLRFQPTAQAFMGLTLVQWLCLAAMLSFGVQLVLIRRGVACRCLAVPRLRRHPAAAN
ncbi:MAG TPA: prolipoprotein diacylglyceryl transferase family protein [Dehalococcoidia bacterium]